MQTIINNCIQSLRKKGQTVNPENIITESLFHSGGTLDQSHISDICEVLDGIRESIANKVRKRYTNEDGLGLGFIIAIETNGYFNYKSK